MTYREVLAAAQELPQKDRSKLVEKLQSGLAEEGLSEEWLAEIERRREQLESGQVKGISWEEVKRDVRKRLKTHGKKTRSAS